MKTFQKGVFVEGAQKATLSERGINIDEEFAKLNKGPIYYSENTIDSLTSAEIEEILAGKYTSVLSSSNVYLITYIAEDLIDLTVFTIEDEQITTYEYAKEEDSWSFSDTFDGYLRKTLYVHDLVCVNSGKCYISLKILKDDNIPITNFESLVNTILSPQVIAASGATTSNFSSQISEVGIVYDIRRVANSSTFSVYFISRNTGGAYSEQLTSAEFVFTDTITMVSI